MGGCRCSGVVNSGGTGLGEEVGVPSHLLSKHSKSRGSSPLPASVCGVLDDSSHTPHLSSAGSRAEEVEGYQGWSSLG